MSKKFSELTGTSTLGLNDLFAIAQEDGGAQTGYASKKITANAAAIKMLNDFEYSSALQTTDKKVIGAINELATAYNAMIPVDTASGPIASFVTELDAQLVNVSCNVLATGGNGTPDNPIPINGYTEANITRCGVNLINNDNAEIGTAWNGASNTARARLIIPCLPNTNYVLTMNGTMTVDGVYFGESETIPPSGIGAVTFPKIFTTANTSKFITLGFNKTNITQEDIDGLKLQLELGSTATAYTPYNGTTHVISFGQTVYGGVLDVTRGKLTVEKAKAIFNGSENWVERERNSSLVVYQLDNAVASIYDENDQISNILEYNPRAFSTVSNMPNSFVIGTSKRLFVQVNISDYADVTAFKTALSNNNLENVYNITPFDIDLTPVQISALVGVNNVYSDTNGDTTVQFKDSIQHYIDKKIAQTQALILS